MTEQSAQELLQKVNNICTFVLWQVRSIVSFFPPQIFPSTQVAGWDLANDNGILKLHQSWIVKNFTKGLDFFKRVADIAESEGIYLYHQQ